MSEESRYVSLAEVKKLLSEESEERELSYEQSLALSHAEKFVQLDIDETEELIEELLENYDFMSEYIAFKMADILPTDRDGVKAVFSQDRYTPSNEEIDDIISTIEEYL